MSYSIDNLIVENSIDAPLSTQVNNALSTKYDSSNPSGFQTAAQVSTAASNAITSSNSYTDGKVAALVAASPAALDTLNELAAALGNDANFAATTSTSLSNRLRIDTAAQGLSGAQKTNTKTNIDIQNVDNTSDINKPISTATQTALNLKYDSSNPNNYETPSQLNTRDTNNRSRANHTGSQTSSTISDFATTVISTLLTGFSSVNSVVVATDTLLAAFGKLQGQITQTISDLASGLALKANNLLTGLVTTNQSSVLATDTVVQGIGKLQAQSNVWSEFVTTAALNNSSSTTLTNITELTMTVIAGKKYRVEGFLIFRTAATTTGIGFTISLSGAIGTIAMTTSSFTGGDGTNSTYSGAHTSSGDLVVSTGVPAATTDYILSFQGIFVCTTGGTLIPQFRSEVNASQVTVGIGSNVIVREF